MPIISVEGLEKNIIVAVCLLDNKNGLLYAKLVQKMLFDCWKDKECGNESIIEMKKVEGSCADAFLRFNEISSHVKATVKFNVQNVSEIVGLSCFINGIILVLSNKAPTNSSDPLYNVVQKVITSLTTQGYKFNTMNTTSVGLYIGR